MVARIHEKISNYRWRICSLVFFATTINYLDRAVISLLKSNLEKEFHWTETDYSNIVVAFQISYALGMLGAGNLIDKIGTKLGYAITAALWSVAAVAHALVKSTLGFMVVRSALGVTESGNFPAAIKTMAEWFPQKERALATGIFNSGANIGAIVAPLTVPFIAEKLGWQWAFIITGLIGFIWLVFWFLIYEIPEKSKRLTNAELAYIRQDKTSGSVGVHFISHKLSWFALLERKPTWAFAIGKFLTDGAWWFYLFWLPDFLKKQYGLNNTGVAWPVAVAYCISTFGSVYGGWLPLYFTKNGMHVLQARRISMLIYACCAVPVLGAQYAGSFNMWLAVTIIGFAMAAHQAWSANMYTTVSDFFTSENTASAIGIGGMFGALGGILIAKVAGAVFDFYKLAGHIETGYLIMFIVCGSVYLLAWVIMRILTNIKQAV
jgi:ACS family hexuronate transporter-like MFS transporter